MPSVNLTLEDLEVILDGLDVAMGRAPEHLDDVDVTYEMYNRLLTVAREHSDDESASGGIDD